MRILTTAATLVLAGSLVMACGDDPTRTASDPEPTPGPGPTSLQPAAATPPEGTRRVTCEVESADGPVTFALDLPADFVPGRPCHWRKRVHVPDEGGYDADITVEVTGPKPRDTLARVNAGIEPEAIEGDDPESDDSILHLDYREAEPAFGATVGERLSYDCYCDGQETLARYAQADDVRVTWRSFWALRDETDEQFATALAGAGTVR